MIDVLIPVLGRPHRVEPLMESLAASTAVPYRLVFLCSEDDEGELEAVRGAGAEHHLHTGPPANGQYAKKINLGYRSTDNPWLFLGADDIHFHPGWAEAALATAGERFHVVALNDKMNAFVKQGLLATHSLVRRSYVDDPGCSLDGPGSIYHEGYNHNFVDCELSVLARHRGVFVFARGAVVEHLHPLANRSQMDPTYEAGLADFAEDRELFVNRCSAWPRDQLWRRFKTAVEGSRVRDRRRRRR